MISFRDTSEKNSHQRATAKAAHRESARKPRTTMALPTGRQALHRQHQRQHKTRQQYPFGRAANRIEKDYSRAEDLAALRKFSSSARFSMGGRNAALKLSSAS